jgi:hypothetical protein
MILDDWYKFSLNKDIIVPQNSSRNNHRQDQTILSGLMMIHEKKYNIIFEKSSFNIKCWVKHDKSAVDDKYKKYVLYQKQNGYALALIHAITLEEAVLIYKNRKSLPLDIFLENFGVSQI